MLKNLPLEITLKIFQLLPVGTCHQLVTDLLKPLIHNNNDNDGASHNRRDLKLITILLLNILRDKSLPMYKRFSIARDLNLHKSAVSNCFGVEWSPELLIRYLRNNDSLIPLQIPSIHSHISHLDLSNASSSKSSQAVLISDDLLIGIINECHRKLEVLQLNNCLLANNNNTSPTISPLQRKITGITEQALQQVARKCFNLRIFTFNQFMIRPLLQTTQTKINPGFIMEFLQNCKRLKSIDLSWSPLSHIPWPELIWTLRNGGFVGLSLDLRFTDSSKNGTGQMSRIMDEMQVVRQVRRGGIRGIQSVEYQIDRINKNRLLYHRCFSERRSSHGSAG